MANDCKPLRGTEQIAEVMAARIAKVQEMAVRQREMVVRQHEMAVRQREMVVRLCDSINRRTNC